MGDECRELINNYPGQVIPARDVRLHPIFEEIGPLEVIVDEDCAVVVLHDAFDHFGVIAFRERTEGTGDEKLLDGLWYYSE